MKKILGILLAVMMMAALLCTAAMAEEEYDNTVPQPEGGMKFEGDWAFTGGLMQIWYEEEGYRVSINLRNGADMTGRIWEYNCYYVEEQDILMSISGAKRAYVVDPATGEEIDGEVEYVEVGESEAVIAFSANGSLTWADASEPDTGADLEFRSIGRFSGVWRSAAGEEPAWVEFTWCGLTEDEFHYSVYLHRGDEETYAEFIMIGVYNEETGKLECTGASIDPEDPETYEAFFSATEDGILYEAANGIAMEYDMLGGSNG